MITVALAEIFERDLNKVKQEISSYTDEKAIWKTVEGISNSAGNLALHICGNLRHFVGNTLGNSGYIRQRDLEFSSKDIPSEILLKNIDETINEVKTAVQNLSEEKLTSIYPIDVFGKQLTTEFFLIHLVAHLNYHLGQINYHRRMIK